MENDPISRIKIDTTDRFGETPLHIVVKSGKINTISGEALLKLLLNYGCSIDVRDRHGKLPIDYVDKKLPAYEILRNSSQTYGELFV